ncbi:acetolactate synthase 3 large subunit, partial [Ralstonia pseudosolanacearum]
MQTRTARTRATSPVESIQTIFCRKLQRTDMNMPSAEFSHANSGSPAEMMGSDILVNALAAEGV